MPTVSPNAIGFFLELHDSLTPSLKAAKKGYVATLRDITQVNANFQRQLNGGITGVGKSLTDLTDKLAQVAKTFATMPSEYAKAVKAIQSSVKPIQQPIEFVLAKGGKGGKGTSGPAGEALAKAFAQVLSNTTMRMVPEPPQRGAGTKQFDTDNLRARYRKTMRPPDFVGGFKVQKFNKSGIVAGDPRIPAGVTDPITAAVTPGEGFTSKPDREDMKGSLHDIVALITAANQRAGADRMTLLNLTNRLTGALQDNPRFLSAVQSRADAAERAGAAGEGNNTKELRRIEQDVVATQKILAQQLAKLPAVVQKDLSPLMSEINDENERALKNVTEARQLRGQRGGGRRGGGGGGRGGGSVNWPRPGGAGYDAEADGGDPFRRVSRGRNRSGYWPWDPTKRIAMMMYLENTMHGVAAMGGSGMGTAEGFAEQYAQQFGRGPQEGRGLALSHLARAKMHGAPLRADQVIGGLDAATRLGLRRGELGREFTSVLMNAQAGGADSGQLADMYTRMIKRGGMSKFQSAQTVDVLRRGAQRSGLRTGILADTAGQYLPSTMLAAAASGMRGGQSSRFTQGIMGVHRAFTGALGGDAEGAGMAASFADLVARAVVDPQAAVSLFNLGVNGSTFEEFKQTGDPTTLLSEVKSKMQAFRGMDPRAMSMTANALGINPQMLAQLANHPDLVLKAGTVAPAASLFALERSAGRMAGQVSPTARSLTSAHDFLGQGLNYATGGAFSPEMLGGVNALGTMADVGSMVVNALLLKRLTARGIEQGGTLGWRYAKRGFGNRMMTRASLLGRRGMRMATSPFKAGARGVGAAFTGARNLLSGHSLFGSSLGSLQAATAPGAKVAAAGASKAAGFFGRSVGVLGKVGGRVLPGLGAAYTGYDAYQRFTGQSDSAFNIGLDEDAASRKGIYNTAYGLSGGLAFTGVPGIIAALAAQGIDYTANNALNSFGSATEGSKEVVIRNMVTGKSDRQSWLGHGISQALSLGNAPSRDELSGMTAANLASALEQYGAEAGEGYSKKFTDAAAIVRNMEIEAKAGGLDRSDQADAMKAITQQVVEGAPLSDAEFEEMKSVDTLEEKSVKWQEMTYKLLSRHFNGGGSFAGGA